ncbi:MAG: 1-deoxy-D-xylulose-5-phosphate reductoisomerase [Bacilli bacterium]|nr:1-deoxy-D-xylulose-5-phosphate reductoisomerase [Bacilli bacterium]
MKKILLLGASGNIGSQSLDIFLNDRKSFKLVGFSVGRQDDKIPQILRDFPTVSSVYLIDEAKAKVLQNQYPNVTFYSGDCGLKELVANTDADMVENALVGFSGLVPSVTALEHNKLLALSNKESLVVGGELINKLLEEGHGKIWPIDSEHVALAKCLAQTDRDHVEEMIITASGGSFRNLTRDQLEGVSVKDALAHPTWNMGAKITIDSATMMNKGFEVLEAHYLYNWPTSNIRVVLHKESFVHSALKLISGEYIADVCPPDMHGPIAYALYEGKAFNETVKANSLEDFGNFTFKPFDPNRYPAVGLCLSALEKGGIMPALLNGANEEAVNLFLKEKIKFTDIETSVAYTMEAIPNIISPTLGDLIEADKLARKTVRDFFNLK